MPDTATTLPSTTTTTTNNNNSSNNSSNSNNSNTNKCPDLKFFDPLCSPDEEMLQMETELINKVRHLSIRNFSFT